MCHFFPSLSDLLLVRVNFSPYKIGWVRKTDETPEKSYGGTY